MSPKPKDVAWPILKNYITILTSTGSPVVESLLPVLGQETNHLQSYYYHRDSEKFALSEK